MSVYDVAIIGGGLSGQLAAFLLSKQGYSVLLCEAQNKLGGRCRVDRFEIAHHIPLDYGLHFNLLTPEQALTLGIEIPWIEVRGEDPLTYRSRNWAPVTPEEISPEQKFFFLKEFSVPRGGVEKLFSSFNLGNVGSIDVKLSTPISELNIQDHVIKKIVSGKESWEAKAFVAALPFSSLTHMVGTEYFHPRFLKKIRKQKMVSAVKLDFILKEKVCELKNILFSLDGNGVGFFPSNVDETLTDGIKQVSQWVFFLTEEELLDAEEVAKKIRAGKRFIQKAWPQFFDHVLWERIEVIDQLFPMEMAEHEEMEKTTLKNLFWISDNFGAPSPKGNYLISHAMNEVQKITAFITEYKTIQPPQV